jgi:hypothetical protein
MRRKTDPQHPGGRSIESSEMHRLSQIEAEAPDSEKHQAWESMPAGACVPKRASLPASRQAQA